MFGHIRLFISAENRTYELSGITHVTPFRKYGKHSTGPSSYGSRVRTYNKLFSSKSVLTVCGNRAQSNDICTYRRVPRGSLPRVRRYGLLYLRTVKYDLWSPDKTKLNSISIVKHTDHMMKFTLMASKWMREWGQCDERHFQNGETDNLPPTVQKTARQQHHLCSWGYSYHSDTELLPTHWSSLSWCRSLLWPNVLFAGSWGWRHREPFYLSYHGPALVIEWQGHSCPFLLDTKPLWHWGKWKSGPTSKRDPWSRHRPTGKCPLHRFEATCQLLHSIDGSNQLSWMQL